MGVRGREAGGSVSGSQSANPRLLQVLGVKVRSMLSPSVVITAWIP